MDIRIAYLILPLLLFFGAVPGFAYHSGIGVPELASSKEKSRYRSACTTAQAQVIQGVNRYLTEQTGIYTKVNNVRAYLLTGGDMWWNRSDAQYIVPHPDDPDEQGVAAIFAGGIWLGGIDPAGNLKTSCQTYGNALGASDFWPGPLDLTGTTNASVCAHWDRFFVVYAEEIDLHRTYLTNATMGMPYDSEDIPIGVKSWPARGNPFFELMTGFPLPVMDQGLAEFWDENGDELYNPLDGDYPILSYRDCESPKYADQMIFWIYNDHGDVHGETSGEALKVEIQALAFSFGTQDALNDMTFQRHKIISRNSEPLDSVFLGLWIDGDLGCPADDLIGCDTTRSLAYVYNSDELDEACMGVSYVYGDEIPILGIDYLRGAFRILTDTVNGELVVDTIQKEMTSFTYYLNSSVGSPPPGITAPQNDLEHYNFLTGRWRDGSPLFNSGSGLMSATASEVTKFAFYSPPDDPDGWSMCTSYDPGVADERMILSSGPGSLRSGLIQEMIFALPWVADQDYPCPSLDHLFAADDLAQEAFDNCFAFYAATSTEEMEVWEAGPLARVHLYPNPVDVSLGGGVVLTGLPAVCEIAIYTADGKLIRTFHRRQEAVGDEHWDMRNMNGVLQSPGMYWIHIKARGEGARVLKCLLY